QFAFCLFTFALSVRYNARLCWIVAVWQRAVRCTESNPSLSPQSVWKAHGQSFCLLPFIFLIYSLPKFESEPSEGNSFYAYRSWLMAHLFERRYWSIRPSGDPSEHHTGICAGATAATTATASGRGCSDNRQPQASTGRPDVLHTDSKGRCV